MNRAHSNSPRPTPIQVRAIALNEQACARRGGLDTITLPYGVISDYTYDAAGRLTSLTHYAPRDAGDDEDTGPITDNEILGQYVYLLREDGRRIGAIEKHDAGTSTGNSDLITTRWAWSYDSMGRLTHEAYDSPGADYVHTYAFDDAGNRESWLKDTDPTFGTTGTGHLTFDVQSFAEEVTVTYAYDDNDRLLTETLDAPGAADDRHTVYDWDGGDSTMQLGNIVYEGTDDTGDVVEDVEQSYNARGRLRGATIDSDGDTDVDVTTTYTYEDSGIRVRQVVERAGQPTSVTEFVVDHQNATGYTQTIEEHSGEGTTATRQVSYTIGLDEIVQAVKDNPAASAVVSQFLHDGRGSVRQLADAVAELVQAATKDAASVLKLDYSAYGTAVNYAAETVATALLHNGEFVDPVTGQQYLRARWYDQATGRFNRIDPFAGEASVPQSLHKYLFAHGDAVTHVDPSGAFAIIPLLVTLALVSAIGLFLFAVINAVPKAISFSLSATESASLARGESALATLVGKRYILPSGDPFVITPAMATYRYYRSSSAVSESIVSAWAWTTYSEPYAMIILSAAPQHDFFSLTPAEQAALLAHEHYHDNTHAWVLDRLFTSERDGWYITAVVLRDLGGITRRHALYLDLIAASKEYNFSIPQGTLR